MTDLHQQIDALRTERDALASKLAQAERERDEAKESLDKMRGMLTQVRENRDDWAVRHAGVVTERDAWKANSIAWENQHGAARAEVERLRNAPKFGELWLARCASCGWAGSHKQSREDSDKEFAAHDAVCEKSLRNRAEQAEAEVAKLRAAQDSLIARYTALHKAAKEALGKHVSFSESWGYPDADWLSRDKFKALHDALLALTAPQPTTGATEAKPGCAKCGGTGFISHAAQQIGPGTVYGYSQVSCPDCFARKVVEPPAPSQPAAASDAGARARFASLLRTELGVMDHFDYASKEWGESVERLLRLLAEDAIAGARGGQAS